MSYLINLDFQIFFWLNNFAGKGGLRDGLIFFWGYLSAYFVALGFILFWFLAKDKLKARLTIFLAFVSYVFSRFVLVSFVRFVLPRQRPFLSHEVIQLINKGPENSFPSGHAASFFALALIVYFYNKKAGWLMFALAAAISVSRVMGGVHYLSDVLAGALAGLLGAWAVKRYYKKAPAHAQKISDWSDKVLQ